MILAIYGTGGAGKESLQIAWDMMAAMPHIWERIVFIDDTKPTGKFKEYEMYPYEIFREKYPPSDFIGVHVALGEISSKNKLASKVKQDGYQFISLVHPTAKIGKNVTLSPGSQIKMRAILHENVSVGEYSWIQAYTIVGPGTQIGSCCQIGAKTVLGQNCRIGSLSFVGMHSILKDQVQLGANTIISMGSMIAENVPGNMICMGNPGRIMLPNEGHKIFKW